MAKKIKGIDVSTFQGNIDWKKVKASGVDCAVIKAGQGRSETSSAYKFTDGKFALNINGAAAAGIAYIGVYYYFTAKNDAEAKAEAAHYLSIISPYKSKINLFAAVDVESKHLSGMTKAALTSAVNTFYKVVEGGGFKCAVYTNPDFIKNRFTLDGSHRLWLALWRPAALVPSGYTNMCMWQWGASAVAGIVGDVDSNIYFAEDVETVDKWKLIQKRCSLDDNTIKYLRAYKYAEPLADKLYAQMV